MPEMKVCVFSSFGAIPAHWKTQKLKTILTLRSEKNSGARELLSVYLDRGVISYSDSTGMQVHKPSQDLSNYQNVHIGDFVLNNQQAWRGSVGVSKYDGIISPAYFVYQLSQDCYSGYMNYLFRDSSMVQQYETSSRGVGTIQRNIFAPWLLNCWTLIPPLDEQRRITDFLDAKCNEIDALAADIQSQIDTLEQYKRSVITEAVTKGLDPDAEMGDSGIDFVGDIPAHWAVHPLYYYFGERKNKNIFGRETNLLSLSYGRIIRKDINSNGGLLPESFNTYNIIEAGDIIIRPTDLQNDKRSLRTGLSKEHGIITSAYIALTPIRPVNTAYFHYLLHAFDVMKVFYNMGNGVRQGLNFSEFSRLMVFEPTIEEQDAIVDMLDKKCGEIDSIITDKRQQMEVLTEYKKSLIFEYVTGKKEILAVTSPATITAIDPHLILAGIAIKGLGSKLLGKIQLEKVLYLFDYYLGLGLNTQYYRFPHGPYDLNLDSYLSTLQIRGWFEKISNSPEKYSEGHNYSEFCQEKVSVLLSAEPGLDTVISFVKAMKKTSQVERAATLFAAWNDFLIDGITPSDDQIICEVINNWTENKARTQYLTWMDSLKKLKKSGIIPKGIGLHTLPMVQRRHSHE